MTHVPKTAPDSLRHLLDNLTRRLAGTSAATRLFLFVVAPVVVVLSLTGAYALNVLEHHFERRMKEDVEMVARSLQLPVSHALERKRLGSLGKSLTSAIRIGRVYGVRLYNRQGEVIASTVGEADEPAPEQVVELDDVDERHREYGEVGGREVYSYFVPLSGSTDNVIGFLQVTRREADFQQWMARTRWMGAGALALVVLLVSGVTLGGYHSAVGRAVRQLRGSMSEIEQGDLDHRAEVDGPREIASVARSLNAMLDSLQEAERRVRHHRRQKADLKDELRESEKMAAVGRVSAGVAHELGNPLSTLAGHLQRLERRHAAESDTGDSLEAMTRETERMQSIIQQMLDFGRASRADRSIVSASRLVELSERRLRQRAAADGVDLELQSADTPEGREARLEVTPARLEQALLNLVENAGRASPGGRVRLSWRRTDRYVIFRVDDDGPGVDPEIRDQLFEPFVTTRSEQGGAGLGLAIVEAVAREHEGFAAVDDSPLGGARFRLALPRYRPPDDASSRDPDHDHS